MSYLKAMALVLTISLSNAAFSQADEAAVKQTITNMFDGMRKSDTALLRSAFAPQAIMQTISKSRDGKTLVRTEPVDSFIHFVGKPHTEVYDERLVFETVKVDGDLAIAWTPYKFYLGEKFLHCGVNSFQLVKWNGEWKIQYIIDTRRRQGCDSLTGF